MLHLSPRAMIVTGVLMMAVGGVIVPFLMVMHTIEATFFLVFTSYAVSVSGLYLGIIGVAQYVRINKKDK